METQSKNQNSKERIVFGVITVLLLLLGSGIYYFKTSALNDKLQNEIMLKDAIATSKLLLEKELGLLRTQAAELRNENATINKKLVATESTLNQKLKEISKLNSDKEKLKRYQKEIVELKKIRVSLLQEIEALKKQNKVLSSENENLKLDNLKCKQKVDSLGKALNSCANVHVASNFRVELQRNKPTSLTTKMKRVKIVDVFFEYQGNPKSIGKQTLYLVLKDTKGNVVNSLGSQQIAGQNVSFSGIKEVSYSGSKVDVEISIDVNKQLKDAGIYTIQIYHETFGIIGQTEIKSN